MSKLKFCGAAALALLAAAPAVAQSSFMADMIGQAVAGYGNAGTPDACYDGRWQPKPKDLAMGPQRVEAAMRAYQQFATTSTDLKPVFTGGKHIWLWRIDGVEQDVRAVRDPWAPSVARVEPIAFQGANQAGTFRALWRAVAADGTVLGTYDGWLTRWDGNTARFMHLDLYSANAAKQPDPMIPFCFAPGDIAKWQEAKAKREAEKAAKRAAKEAAMAARDRP
jgi:hypothetical protein